MTEAPATREALELALRDYVAESRRERTSRFSPDMLAWLALPPRWTGRLARQAGFPNWDPAFPDAAAKEGLCARTGAPRSLTGWRIRRPGPGRCWPSRRPSRPPRRG